MHVAESQSICYTSRDVRLPQPLRSRDRVVQGAIVGKKSSVRIACQGSVETPGEKDGGACWMPVGEVALIVVHILFVAWRANLLKGRTAGQNCSFAATWM